MRTRRTALLATIAIACVFAVSARAETPCEAEIAAVERAMLDNPALEMAPQGRRDRIESILAEAGEAAIRGDEERCLEKVEAAKGMAGLR